MILRPRASKTRLGFLMAPLNIHSMDSHWFLLIESPTKTSLLPLISSSIFTGLNLNNHAAKYTQYPTFNQTNKFAKTKMINLKHKSRIEFTLGCYIHLASTSTSNTPYPISHLPHNQNLHLWMDKNHLYTKDTLNHKPIFHQKHHKCFQPPFLHSYQQSKLPPF